ncbi:MAG: anaerobic ribonucleoside-triphosphate reductase activating protein [Desulfovibrio sp.]|nr:anaerobic ribonucleoside-triphosphate reductase activating protein [Desulfovibrio sp.]
MSIPEIALAGMHKLTALDYPGLVSAIVFTQGCNFDCPYCHNPRLKGKAPLLETQTVLGFLKKRAGLLDGLVVSGGEPTLQKGLEPFCREAKRHGYRIKLDTNGSRPEVLRRLLEESLVDYVAMDCKTAPGDYASAFCPEPDIEEKIRASASLLRASKTAHEFRTTCVSPFVSPARLSAMAEMTGTASPWFFQEARLGGNWTGDCAPMPPQAIRELLFLAEGFGTRPQTRN